MSVGNWEREWKRLIRVNVVLRFNESDAGDGLILWTRVVRPCLICSFRNSHCTLYVAHHGHHIQGSTPRMLWSENWCTPKITLTRLKPVYLLIAWGYLTRQMEVRTRRVYYANTSALENGLSSPRISWSGDLKHVRKGCHRVRLRMHDCHEHPRSFWCRRWVHQASTSPQIF